MKRILPLLLIVFFSFNLLFAAQSNETVTVVYANKWQPYSSGNGTYVKGILVDIVDELLTKRLQLNVENIGQPWRRAQKSARAGLVDAIITAPTADRLTYLQSSSNELYSIQWKVFVSKKSRSYSDVMRSDDPLSFRSLNFISLLGDRTSERFYEQNNIKYERVQNISNAINMLSRGRADIFLHSKIIMFEHLNKLNKKQSVGMHDKEFKSVPFTFLLSKKSKYDKKLISDVDTVINEMKANDEYEEFIKEVEKKYIN